MAAAPPLLLPQAQAPKPGGVRRILAGLLSLCLAVFLADGLVSVVDDSLVLLFGIHLLTGIRGLVSLFTLLTGLLLYGLMGLTPMVPKRLFLPIALFNPVTLLALIPLAIYFQPRIEQVAWIVSLCQLAVGLAVVCWARGGFRLRGPLITEKRLRPRPFGWVNLSVFLLVNIFGVLPAVMVYLAVCAALAVGQFSEGFMALRPSGFTVQVRKYVRDDGKTIELVPMAHIGDQDFYRKLSQSFPTNSLVLMEGVTDERNLLTNRVTYKRLATSLGLAEQHEEFNPVQAEQVRADVDVADFRTNTIGFLNLVMLIHAKGPDLETLLKLLGQSPPPGFEEQLLDDLLRKRNEHLLQEIHDRLPGPKPLIVPWGVAHMPGIQKGIRASGFRLAETQDYPVIRFRATGNHSKGPRK